MNADKIRGMTEKVTKKWAKQRVKEIKDKQARLRRVEVYSVPPTSMPLTRAVKLVMPEAYAQASNNGEHPALRRQVFYKVRPLVQKLTDRELTSDYFLGTLLPDYLSTHPDNAKEWQIAADPRGHLTEPHTGKVVPVGTLEIAAYLREIAGRTVGVPELKKFTLDHPTCGTKNRCSAVLFLEKEGFGPLIDQVELAERYDLMIISTKGQSTTSARELVDELCAVSDIAGGVPLLILHDFDKAGFLIAECLTRVSLAARKAGKVRYEFKNEISWVDIGLRLDDAKAWGLESEYVRFKGKFADDTITTPEEQAFLKSDKRIELNAFSSGDLIAFIEGKLKEHGIKKVVPDAATIEEAYRRALQLETVNKKLPALFKDARKVAADAEIPGLAGSIAAGGPSSLEDAVRRLLANNPAQPWDQAVAQIVKQHWFWKKS